MKIVYSKEYHLDGPEAKQLIEAYNRCIKPHNPQSFLVGDQAKILSSMMFGENRYTESMFRRLELAIKRTINFIKARKVEMLDEIENGINVDFNQTLINEYNFQISELTGTLKIFEKEAKEENRE